ncbi:hypothetical protein GCM10027451_22110 [Geodermatophilus aquaeductus]|uniref:Mce-associated membrane protein n=1 Tax=Geodermatophilus aquaeductus TaxID=1564161 RepID=A0A521AN21_9ACTN|nr:hypothetical protein [Geodermatophilus aquaeductus]SMO36219.1 Mce-associated membrane protein [Geodermatophilus aquaeductus]
MTQDIGTADETSRTTATGLPAEDTTEDGKADDQRPASRRRLSVPLVPVLAVLLVLLLAAATWLALPWFRGDDESPVRTDSYVEVLQAARSGIVDLTSFDAVTIDDDIEQVRRVATGDLRDESLAQLQDRRQELVDAQAVVQTEVVGAGVVSADEDSGTVLLVIQSTQQSTAGPQAQVLRYRIQVELVRQDGRWLLSGISGR